MKQIEFEQAIVDLPLTRQEYFPTIGSTNDAVANWAREGTQGLALAAADEQTRGRGRAGRRWVTPTGSALAFSLLLERASAPEPATLARAAGLGAVAVCEALEANYSLRAQIKWPNDVLLNGKKVCGVLPEAHWTGEHLQALILGIGINVAAKSVPPAEGLSFPATSIEESLGHQVPSGELLRAILFRLIEWKDRLSEPGFIEAWDAWLAYKGQSVIFAADSHSIEAELLGLAEDGGLKLKLPSGEVRAFQMGEIQIRPTEHQ